MPNLGTRLNNWLNIRYNIHNQWKGQIGQQQGFVEFDTVVHGLRAARIILEGYLKRGNNSVNSVISTWSPSNENDTEGYIKFVCSQTGFDRNKTLQVLDISPLIKAMAKMETGNIPLDSELAAAWKEV